MYRVGFYFYYNGNHSSGFNTFVSTADVFLIKFSASLPMFLLHTCSELGSRIGYGVLGVELILEEAVASRKTSFLGYHITAKSLTSGRWGTSPLGSCFPQNPVYSHRPPAHLAPCSRKVMLVECHPLLRPLSSISVWRPQKMGVFCNFRAFPPSSSPWTSHSAGCWLAFCLSVQHWLADVLYTLIFPVIRWLLIPFFSMVSEFSPAHAELMLGFAKLIQITRWGFVIQLFLWESCRAALEAPLDSRALPRDLLSL